MKKIFHGFLFILQYCFYYFIYPLAIVLYGNKRVWIICERGDDARDNGFWMAKHLHSEHPYVNQYYLIKKKSADYSKVKSISKVVRYKSLKHWLLYIAAEVRMSTHLAAFAPGNFIGEWFKHHKQKGVNVFLQHGITHNEFPSNYFEHNGSDLFICGAQPEFDFISKNYNYPDKNVIYTGFSRFDGLFDFSTKRQILIMPSWRNYLFDCSKDNFKDSSYYKHWNSLLCNEALLNYCRKYKISIIFYPHYSMQKFLNLFSVLNNDVVTIADFNHFDVQTLLKESNLLITDYSSILFDFAYMKKPQFLYQFDENDFYGKHYKHSYFDHRKDGFGEVCIDETDLVSKIIAMNGDFCIGSNCIKRIENFFPLFDDNNSERIYQNIVKKFISKKKTFLGVNDLNANVVGDDYGRNFEASEGIRQAFSRNYIQFASIIVNKDEKDCLNVNDIDKDKFRLHLNLTEGYSSFGDTNNYAYSVNTVGSISHDELNTRKAYFYLSDKAIEVVRNEVFGQISKYKKLGFNNLAFDSHGHIHTKKPIAKIVANEFYKEGFVSTRRTSNLNRGSLLKSLYKKSVTRYYKKFFKTSDYFGSCDDFIHIKHYRKYRNKTIEIMTHPFINKDGKLTNRKDIDFDLLYSNRK